MTKETAVVLHFGPKEDIRAHDETLTAIYGGIITGVQEAGHTLVVTRGKASYMPDGVREWWSPVVDSEGSITTTRRIGAEALRYCDIGVIRAYINGLSTVVPEINRIVPVLNPEVVRKIDRSKWRQKRLLGGRQVPTALVDQGVDLGPVYDLAGDHVFLKPDLGAGGRGVLRVAKADIATTLESLDGVPHVAQEELDSTIPFPDYIVGIDSAQKAIMHAKKHCKKELRLMVFYGGLGKTQIVPIARIMPEVKGGRSTWVFIDPEQLPEELTNRGYTAFEALSKETGVAEIHGALDVCYGTTVTDPEARWWDMELNLWQPVFPRGNEYITRLLNKGMVDQLVRIAATRNSEGVTS